MAKIKIARPKVRELRTLYKGLISTSIAQRISTLATVLQWYDQAIDYVMSKGKFDAARQKKLDQAFNARKNGLGATIDHEKEQSFRTAIRLLETFATILHPYPLEKAYAAYEKKKPSLERKTVHLESKYGTALATLNSALKPMGASGKPLELLVTEQQENRKFNPTLHQLTYSRAQAKQLQETLRQRGVLPLIAQEIKFLSRGAATEENANGGFVRNTEKQVDAILGMLTAFVEYSAAADAPRRLIKQGALTAVKVEPSATAEQSTTPAQKAPRIARQGGLKGVRKGPMTDGLFVAGTAAEVVYRTMKDEQWHQKDALQKLIPQSGLFSRLRVIKVNCSRAGYKFEQDGEKVRLQKGA